MSLPRLIVLLSLVAGSAHAAGDGWLVGAGLELDTDDGVRASLLAGVGLGDATWLSGAAATSTVDYPARGSSDTLYLDVEMDHRFDPVGISVGAAYWGDPDILDSNDLRASVYWDNDKVMIAADYEFRDFDFIIPPSDFFPGREFAFDASGIGARLRFRLGDTATLRLSAMNYDYSIGFRPDLTRDAISLITVSRLSPINNLIDGRAGVGLDINAGVRRWQISVLSWKGALDRSRTRSYTLRFLTPLGGNTDIELGVGFDDSDIYDDATYFSLYLYFYGD